MKMRTALAMLLAAALLWAGLAAAPSEAPMASTLAAALHADASEAFPDLQELPGADHVVRLPGMPATSPRPAATTSRVDPYLRALRRPPRTAAHIA